MKKRKKILSIYIGLSFLGLLTVIFLATLLFSQKPTNKKSISTYTVVKQPDRIFQGKVVPSEEQDEFFDPSLGTIVSIDVKDGEKVKSGDPLLTYQSKETNLLSLQYSVKSSELALTNSQENLQASQAQLAKLQNQYKKLLNEQEKINEDALNLGETPESLEKQIDSLKQTIQQNEQTVSSDNLRVEEANANLQQALNNEIIVIRARRSGIITLGSIDDKEKPLIKISSEDTRIQAQVSEYDYNFLKENMKVKIQTLAEAQSIDGAIDSIASIPLSGNTVTPSLENQIENSTAFYSFIVKPSHNLQYGYSAQVHLSNPEILIPKSCIKDGYVQVQKEDSTFRKVRVVAKQQDGQMRIISGLKIGDIILKDGETVENDKT